MNDKILNVIKEKPIIIPKVLFKNYKKLNVTEEELIILIYIINIGEKIVYNPIVFSEELNLDKYKVMQLLTDLTEKNIITIKVEKNTNNISEEYIYTDILYQKLLNIIIDEEKEKPIINTDIFTLFEQELGRTLSPMECEIIKEWTNDNYAEELIKEALKEAIYNNVRNLRYVDRVLYNWKNKGLTTKQAVINDKKNFKKPVSTITEVFDYNWLEDE